MDYPSFPKTTLPCGQCPSSRHSQPSRLPALAFGSVLSLRPERSGRFARSFVWRWKVLRPQKNRGRVGMTPLDGLAFSPVSLLQRLGFVSGPLFSCNRARFGVKLALGG